MSNFKNPDSKAVSALLSLAASKFGTTPEQLEAMLKSGKADRAVSGLPKDQQDKLRAALADPEAAKKVLSSPQARSLMEKLKKK
ncbi:hypothetical protein SAMN02910317_01624 [Ruminococcaceae bacterium FB2012]|nr:hypothetical protein SAMN02910317_01624 [Ruminococcaceae bacterium FB2012]